MNTGVQRSGATPPAARTATTEPLGGHPGNAFGQGKNVPLIAMAHEIPYVATATVAELRDLERKVARAMEFRGPRYLHVLVPCPLGWGSAPSDTINIARLAKESGLFPVFEAEDGRIAAVSPIRRLVPVEHYLRPPEALRAPVRRRRQARGHRACCRPPQTATSSASACSPRRTTTSFVATAADRSCSTCSPRVSEGRNERDERPFAITLDVGSSLANHTGAWRTERPQYVRRLPPCNNACPAGEDVQRWLYEAESGGEGYERAWRALVRENPFPAVMGRICYHPCETACNRCELDEAVGINSVERFLGDEAIRRGLGAARSPHPRPAGACSSSAPDRAGLSAAYHLALRGHHVTIKDAAPEARRDDALRHPRLPASARGARRRDRAHPRAGSRAALRRACRRTCSASCATAPSTRPSSPSARTWRATSTSPAAPPPTCIDAVSMLHDVERGRGAAARPTRRRLRRRRHGARRGPQRAAAHRQRAGDRLPAHARAHARPPRGARSRPSRRGSPSAGSRRSRPPRRRPSGRACGSSA